ncbi:MAG: biotin--[acetyl-CoA-carboxylase] ligase [Treponema sp. CETP13]|nr:MAG: biotin--[acetyl-CoA-carboxylase] ligase [Treponema sp. CETP13]
MKTSEKVLELLKKHKRSAVSGEEIAKELQISRTSVWKAINKLINEGYLIKAQRKTGYQLLNFVDSLDLKQIEKNLNNEVLSFCKKTNSAIGSNNTKIELFSEIDSTNTEAKKRLSSNTNSESLNGTVLIAEKQTAGRGRLGRSFYSPGHNGIYMSIIFKSNSKTIDTTVMTAAAAVAVCRVLEKYNIAPKIKWVNDIYINDKKICGILTEGTINLETGVIDAIVLGIGINVYSTASFSKELKEIAGVAFSQNDSSVPDRNELTAKILNEVCAIYLHPEKLPVVMNEYSEYSMVKGKFVTVFQGEKNFRAKVVNITSKAHLIVEKENGEKMELLSGEVSIKPQI